MLQEKIMRKLAYSVPFTILLMLTLNGCVSEQGQGVAPSGQLYEVFSPGSDVPHFVTADKISEYTQGQPQSGMEQEDASQDDQEQYQRAVQQDLSNREFLRNQQGLQ